MKTRWLVVLAIGFLAGTVVRSDDKPGAKDNIQGTWSIVSLEGDGETVPAEKIKGAKVIIITFSSPGNKEETSYTLDPSKKPRHLDLARNGKRRAQESTCSKVTI